MAEDSNSMNNPGRFKFEAMSIGMILDRSIQLVIRNYLLLIGIMAPVHLLIFTGEVLLTPYYQTLFTDITSVWIFFGSLLLEVFLYGIGNGAVTIAISTIYLDREVSVTGAYSRTLRRIASYMIAFLAAMLFTVLVLAAGIVSVLILSGMLSIVLPEYVAGIIILITVIGVLGAAGIFAVRYVLISPVVMLENLGANKSRTRSSRLTIGCRGRLAGLALLFYLARFILVQGIHVVYLLAIGLSLDNLWTGNQWMYSPSVLLLTNIVSLLIAPFPAVLFTLVYYNQRIRKEGFDLDILAESVAAP